METVINFNEVIDLMYPLRLFALESDAQFYIRKCLQVHLESLGMPYLDSQEQLWILPVMYQVAILKVETYQGLLPDNITSQFMYASYGYRAVEKLDKILKGSLFQRECNHLTRSGNIPVDSKETL